MMGTYSFRNFKVGKQFRKEYNNCKKAKDKFNCEVKVRDKYKLVEDGRLHKMAESINKFIDPLDKDEKIKFKKEFPDVVKINNEYGLLEDRPQY